MDHNEAIRSLERLLQKEADHAHEKTIELEALVLLLPNGKARELATLQGKENHKHSKELRELAQKVKEN
jgi:hypothetical protein